MNNNKYKNTKLKYIYESKQNNSYYSYLFSNNMLIAELFIIVLFVIVWRIKINNDYKKKKWNCYNGVCNKKDHIHSITSFKVQKKTNNNDIMWQDSLISSLLFKNPEINMKEECDTMDVAIGKQLDYEKFASYAKPFDAIFMRSDTIVGYVVRQSQNYTRNKCKLFSHVAVLINTSVIKLDGMIDGEWYIIESVVTNLFNYDPIKNIAGKTFSGVQIRSLRSQMKDSINQSTLFLWCPLKPKVREIIETNYDEKMYKKMIVDLLGKNYTTNMMNFFTAFNPKLFDWIRQFTGSVPGSTYFCSEFVCYMYQQQGIIDPHVESKYIFPADFFDIEKINPPIFYKIYPLRYDNDNNFINNK